MPKESDSSSGKRAARVTTRAASAAAVSRQSRSGVLKSGKRFSIALRIADPAWKADLPDLGRYARRILRGALAAELPGNTPVELSLLLTDDAEMARLNTDWRGKPKPTNVLSFPAEDAVDPQHPPAYLGDIALGHGICAREAARARKSLADHFGHLLVHGALHLLGYDHETDEQAAAMEPRESVILAGFGIADPYMRRASGKSGAQKSSQKKAGKRKRT
ncbi:MAG: rRNA maturation RNase YbeY [Ferrovibrio sp.]|nr:rRNA maturation RNase YbeY [Ferrovibrio sp.]